MPLVILPTMPSLRASILAISTFAPDTLMPCSPSWLFTFSNSSDEASKAFDGMQPTFKQVPPSAPSPAGFFQRSTHATLKPSCAARIAAMYPAGPEPMTTASKRSDIPSPPSQNDDQAGRIFHRLLDCDEEQHRFAAVDDPMVVRQREIIHRSHHDLAVLDHGTLLGGMDAEDGRLRRVDDGGRKHRAEHTAVAD